MISVFGTIARLMFHDMDIVKHLLIFQFLHGCLAPGLITDYESLAYDIKILPQNFTRTPDTYFSTLHKHTHTFVVYKL